MASELVSSTSDLEYPDACVDLGILDEKGVIENTSDGTASSLGRNETDAIGASGWSTSSGKRVFDVACVMPMLILMVPALLLIAVIVRITSEGPVLFRQERMGKERKMFTIYKFRTMYYSVSRNGPCVTRVGDPRLTPLGRFLRKYKLDEIPQLYNVLRGEMSLVGPRPKLAKFEYAEMVCRPGITGAATLAFAKEEEMLNKVPPEDLDSFHLEVLSPMKAELDDEYQKRATFFSDLAVLFDTLLKRGAWTSLDEASGQDVAWQHFLTCSRYRENTSSDRKRAG